MKEQTIEKIAGILSEPVMAGYEESPPLPEEYAQVIYDLIYSDIEAEIRQDERERILKELENEAYYRADNNNDGSLYISKESLNKIRSFLRGRDLYLRCQSYKNYRGVAMLSPEKICKVICMDDDESEIKECLNNNPDGCKVLKAGKELLKAQEAETLAEVEKFLTGLRNHLICVRECRHSIVASDCLDHVGSINCPAWQAMKGMAQLKE